jgi:hypothetical protein
MAILTLDHIRGPWLRILDALTGEDEPDALPGKRLARERANLGSRQPPPCLGRVSNERVCTPVRCYEG